MKSSSTEHPAEAVEIHSHRPLGETLLVVSLKAFGDLVIARRAMGEVDTTSTTPPTMVLGAYLAPLFDALGDYQGACKWIDCNEVPAIFDVKRQGIVPALRSARSLRREFHRLSLMVDDALVFDRLGPRERFIAGRRKAEALPPANNIYVAYRKYLAAGGFPLREASAVVHRPAHTVAIFPASRIPAKNLPVALIKACVDSALARNLTPTVYLLEGERPELRASIEQVVVIERSFFRLAEAVRSADRVLAADSLPAHLAEFFNRPVHVLTPASNPFWLPFSAFVRGRWSRFDPMRAATAGVCRFLSEPA